MSELITPSLLIGIGTTGSGITETACSIYKRSNSKRNSVTRTLFLGGLMDDQYQSNKPVNNKTISEQIEKTLHELYTYENLSSADIDIPEGIPSNIIITCDLLEDTSSQLVEILKIINQIHSDFRYSRVILLLSIASFPDKKKVQTISSHNLYEELKRIEKLLIQAQLEFFPMVFLFSEFKTGSVVVADKIELKILMENALISLLMGDFGINLSEKMPISEMISQKTLFHGIGSCLLVNQPDLLINACADKFTKEFVQDELLGSTPRQQIIDRISTLLFQQTDNERLWTEKILDKNPCNLVDFTQNGPELGVRFPELSLKSIDILNLMAIEWRETILNFIQELENGKEKSISNLMHQKSAELSNLYSEKLSIELNAIPSRVELHPGISRAAKTILENFGNQIKTRQMEIEKYKPEKVENDIITSINSDMDEVDKILDSAPKLRPWVFFFPKFIQKILAFIIRSKWLVKNSYSLYRLRENAIKKVESKYSAIFTNTLNKELISVSNGIGIFIEKYRKQFERLENTFQKTYEIPIDPPPLTRKEQGFNHFRPSLVNEGLVNWAYMTTSPTQEGSRVDLIDTRLILEDWMIITPEILFSRIHQYGEEKFTSLRSIPLSDLLFHWMEVMLLKEQNAKESLSKLFYDCSLSSNPLLRPDFDRVGGMRFSSHSYWVITAESSKELLEELFKPKANHSYASSGDNNSIAFAQILSGVPLEALESLFN